MNVYYNNPLCINRLPFELIWEIYRYLPPHPLKTIFDDNRLQKHKFFLEVSENLKNCPPSQFFIYSRLINLKKINLLNEEMYNDTPIMKREKFALSLCDIQEIGNRIDNDIGKMRESFSSYDLLRVIDKTVESQYKRR